MQKPWLKRNDYAQAVLHFPTAVSPLIYVWQLADRMLAKRIVRFWPAIAPLCALIVGMLCSSGVRAMERGTWFWYQSSDPNGAANIVGNLALEDEAIAFFERWEITRLYGSYSSLPTSNPGAMAAWNRKLALAGIDSYVVLSDPDLVLPGEQASLQNLVTTRFVNFNNSRSDPQQRFVGIELDLEPHTLPAWSSGTNVGRRDLLFNLRDAYSTVRQRLVSGGYAGSQVSAALPVWFDSSSTIGWTNSAERDQWFVDISSSLDAISLMAYETSSVATIISSTSYERSNFNGDAIVALRSKLGEEWSNYTDFASATASVETQINGGIDIESYYRLRQIVPEPSLPGDFNSDGAVDVADYVMWRKGGPLQNDFTPGIGTADYVAWKSAFGEPGEYLGGSTSAPEPASWNLVVCALLVLLPLMPRRHVKSLT